MWSYYGAKTNVIKFYPRPRYDKIIEPFAGTARYALQYFEKEVLIVDKYPVIIDIWKYLQACSPADILGLPRLKRGDNINDITFDCEAQRNLVGFLIGFGFPHPRSAVSPRLRDRPNAMNFTIKKIARDLYKIRHWVIKLGSYEEIENQVASWFIDPPYQVGGHKYRHSNKKIDFVHLAEWSRSREGQIIVCENTKATWMDFKPVITQRVLSGMNLECIWTNQRISAINDQHTLDL